MTYSVIYSPEAYKDLRSIYMYIAFELLSPGNAKSQIDRIRGGIRKLDIFPEGHSRVDWEPWASMQMHYIPIDNYIVYYLIDTNLQKVEIVRIFYGRRDVEAIVNKVISE